MPIKVCHISTVHSAFDDRIFHKECRTLAQKGYEVSLVVSHDKREQVEGVNIEPLPDKDGRLYRVFNKSFIAFKKAKSIKADIYHFHDPELILIGFMLKLLGNKVVYDVHEDVPKQILNKEWLGPLFLRKIVSLLFNCGEKFIARFFDGVSTVTDDIVRKFACNKRVILLRNLPVVSIIDACNAKSVEEKEFTLLYAGGLTEIRGIREIIKAVGLLDGKAKLILLGKWDSSEYEKACRNEQGWKNTIYLGFKPIEEVYSYMKSVNLGICTLYPTQNHLKSWPVKVFEYMACSLPVLMSNFPYWMDIFNKHAIFVNPKEPKDIAAKIEQLLDNPKELSDIGKANRELVEKQYSWEAENQKLIDLYEDICNKKV